MTTFTQESQVIRYDRQILIENWDQEKIREGKVIIVGMGALGSVAAVSLAMAGVGELILVDFDTIEISNLNRQLLFQMDDIGKSKVEVAARELLRINSELKVTTLNMKIQDVPKSDLESASVIVEGLDTFIDRRWVNSFIIEYNIPFISAGMFGFLGNLQVIIPNESACLECQSLIPEEELQKACTPFGELRKEVRQKEPLDEIIPSVSSVSFVIGGLMAQEALKILLELSTIKEYLFWDGTAGVFTAIELLRREDCFVCSSAYQLNAIPVRSDVDQQIDDFMDQLQYSFNLGKEMVMIHGTVKIDSSKEKLSEVLDSADIIRVIDPSLSKPLKFQISFDS
ncbi:MAG: HesA/MoeB/ThiF family protein [Candidatus Hodarchaeales archaeon]|jgi:adenylyltransferase/sulfurtransferase